MLGRKKSYQTDFIDGYFERPQLNSEASICKHFAFVSLLPLGFLPKKFLRLFKTIGLYRAQQHVVNLLYLFKILNLF